MEGLRKICDEKNILLIFDEVQCGIGRSGKMFAHQWSGIVPDIMTIAKALGNGFPIGACLTSKKVGETMGHGTHGSTFGGNPLACSVGRSVLELMDSEFFTNLSKTSNHLIDELSKIINDFPEIIAEVRGKGLILGLKCKIENTAFVDELRNHKMLTIKASDNVVRLLPPLNISIKDCDVALSIIRKACKKLS